MLLNSHFPNGPITFENFIHKSKKARQVLILRRLNLTILKPNLSRVPLLIQAGPKEEIEKQCAEFLNCISEIRPNVGIRTKAYNAVKILCELGASRDQVIRMVKGNPKLFLFSQGKNIGIIHSTFQSFEIDTPSVLKSFARFPYLASKEPSEVETILHFLKHELKVKNLSRIVTGCPSIFGYRREKLESKARFYCNLGMNAARLIELSPSILNYNEEEIKLKLEFFKILFGDETPTLIEKQTL